MRQSARGAASEDGALWVEVPWPEAGRRPATRSGRSSAGADPCLAGRRLQAVRRSHCAQHVRVRPRGAGEHRLLRADPGIRTRLCGVPLQLQFLSC